MRWAAGRSQRLRGRCSHSSRRLSTGERRLEPARIRRPFAASGHSCSPRVSRRRLLERFDDDPSGRFTKQGITPRPPRSGRRVPRRRERRSPEGESGECPRPASFARALLALLAAIPANRLALPPSPSSSAGGDHASGSRRLLCGGRGRRYFLRCNGELRGRAGNRSPRRTVQRRHRGLPPSGFHPHEQRSRRNEQN